MITREVRHGRIGANINCPGTGIIIKVGCEDDEARAVLTKQEIGQFVDLLRRLLVSMHPDKPSAESEAKR